MNLSHRERIIAIAAVAAFAVLVLDYSVLTPVLGSRERLQVEGERLAAQTEQALSLFQRSKVIARRRREMAEKGLKEAPGEAESQALHAVRDWAEQTGLSLSSVKPEYVAGDGGVRQIAFRAAGTGTMRAVARFLWQMESADLPLRVHDVQLGSRTEGRDDLSLQLHFSTLYTPPVERAEEPRAAANEEDGL